MDFEVDLDRQVLQPGDEVIGWVTLGDPEVKTVELAFQGEEILGASHEVTDLLLRRRVERQLVQPSQEFGRKPGRQTVQPFTGSSSPGI